MSITDTINLIVFFLLLNFTFIVSGQGIVINELMSDNETTIKDSNNKYSDWIELYNACNHPINLYNYGLSDKKNKPYKWTFPEITILPNNHLLIFASGKSNKDIANLHTNFKISSQGEELFLTDNNGHVIDSTPGVALDDDEVYQREPDGSPNWAKSFFASPGANNIISKNTLDFSHNSGFYRDSFSLKIDSHNGDTIYCTQDGSLPTKESGIYIDSIIIDSKKGEKNYFSEIPTSPPQNLLSYKAWESPDDLIEKATILRCASFNDRAQTSRVFTKTFFVGKELYEKYSFPVISLVTEEKNLFGIKMKSWGVKHKS